jgi:hypothetical protein
MSDRDRTRSDTCPRCGAPGALPVLDEWWCSACRNYYPTRAFRCQHPGCLEWVLFSPFCEAHTLPKGGAPGDAVGGG